MEPRSDPTATPSERGDSSPRSDERSDAHEPIVWVDIMDAEDLWMGQMLGVQSVMCPLLLVNLDGAVYAYEDRCPHTGGRLSDGELANGIITCPRHHWEFRAEGGCGVNPKGTQLNPYAVRIIAGRIMIGQRRD